MDIALWVAAIFVAVAFLFAGGLKVATPRSKLHEQGMTYVEDFSDSQMKLIGAVEVLGAVGLVAPAFVEPANWLVPTAATGLALMMVGAIVTHARRRESFAPALVLGLLSAFVAVGRFWIAPF